MQDQVDARVARVALVAGATGLVGQAVLAALLTDKHYAAVHCVGRRSPALKHPKLIHHVVDLVGLKRLPGIGPRSARRIGPDGQIVFDLVAEVVQRCRVAPAGSGELVQLVPADDAYCSAQPLTSTAALERVCSSTKSALYAAPVSPPPPYTSLMTTSLPAHALGVAPPPPPPPVPRWHAL